MGEDDSIKIRAGQYTTTFGTVVYEDLKKDEFIEGVPFQGGAYVAFHEDGHVFYGTLAQDFENLPAGSRIFLNQEGDITRALLGRDCVIDGRMLSWGTWLTFDPEGNLTSPPPETPEVNAAHKDTFSKESRPNVRLRTEWEESSISFWPFLDMRKLRITTE